MEKVGILLLIGVKALLIHSNITKSNNMLSVVNDYAGIVAELHILVIAFSGYVSCNDISIIQHRLNFPVILFDDVD